MVTNVGIKFGVQRRKLLFVSLMLVVFLFSLFSYTLMADAETSLEDVVHVGSERELRAAVRSTKYSTQIIVLERDITLIEDTLVIPAGKDIVLTGNNTTGFYRLIGATEMTYEHELNIASSHDTIAVAGGGVLRLNGISVTHAKDVSGTGVCIYGGGTLVMLSGNISGNHIPYTYTGHGHFEGEGGGVYNYGVFEMFGGEISGNTAGNVGGGVYNLGNFTMHGGKISDNTAKRYGGGVTTIYNGFEMFGGEITNNTAGEAGGGVDGTFNKYGGEIYDNTAPIGTNTYPLTNDNDGPFTVNKYSLRTVMVICVGVIVVIVVVLFLYFKLYKPSSHGRDRKSPSHTNLVLE
jgi:hypothetical protein